MSDKPIIKSPLNYIGGKYKLLPQLLPLMPDDIKVFVDLFGGGFNVGINVNSERVIYNDIVYQVADLMKKLSETNNEQIISHIRNRIDEFSLSKTNADGFYRFRDLYNKEPMSLDLYVLVCFSFNHQIRFNNNMQYNNPFGKNRSSFSKSLETKLGVFVQRLQSLNTDFCSLDFTEFDYEQLTAEDLVYCDPPYLISTAAYNDGKRGFKGWNEELEIALLNRLDELNEKGVRFALSNVLEHKGKTNRILEKWSAKYTVHNISHDYSNSNYQTKNRDRDSTKEILVTNY